MTLATALAAYLYNCPNVRDRRAGSAWVAKEVVDNRNGSVHVRRALFVPLRDLNASTPPTHFVPSDGLPGSYSSNLARRMAAVPQTGPEVPLWEVSPDRCRETLVLYRMRVLDEE